MSSRSSLIKLLPKRPTFTALDGAAIGSGTLLSIACLARGAVYDSMVALLLIGFLPLLWFALRQPRDLSAPLKTMGMVFLAAFVVVLMLQQFLPASGETRAIWEQVQRITGQEVRSSALTDPAAWFHGAGRFLLFILVFVVALFVGSSESSARKFLLALLISGVVCVTITFFLGYQEKMLRGSTAPYSHGFVNANNAAAYLGILLLVTLAHAARFFKLPSESMSKLLLNFMDGLNMNSVVKGGFLLFAVLLTLIGLFVTASRGGILVSLLSAAFFCLIVLLKMKLPRAWRNVIILLTLGFIAVLLVWSFTNYGQNITRKLETDGTSSNSRFAIFAAVLPMIGDHPLLGAGLGSFPSAFQRYRPETVSADGIIDKAHNSYLEFAAEMGVPLFLLLMLFLGRMGVLLWQTIRTREQHYVLPTLGLCTLLLVAMHSLIDFPLQIPGIAATCIAVLTVCVAQADPRFAHSQASVKRRRIRRRRSSPPKAAPAA